MDKILLVGESHDAVKGFSESLSKDYQIYFCVEHIKKLQVMINVVRPDLVILFQMQIQEMDAAVFHLFQEQYPQILILGVTTSEGWKQCKDFYRREQCHVLFRPVEKSELLEKCHQILNTDSVGTWEEDNYVSRRKKRILIVDDSALLLRSMKNMLENYYEIYLAKSGEQALKVIPKVRPDLILLDYEMQGLDGKDTFEVMKSENDMKDIPVVFLTSISDSDSIYSILKLEPEGYLLKPPNEKKIRMKIEELLQNGTIHH